MYQQNKLEDFQKTSYGGMYRGIVEENVLDDDKKNPLGRVRVRIFGIHTAENSTSDTDGIPVDHLPIAEPALPLFGGGSNSGFGMNSVPLKGSMVWLFLENNDPNKPVYFASAPGIPKNKSDGKGFSDPDKKYPLENRLNESDLHRLSRGKTDKTQVAFRNDNVKTGLKQGDDNTFDEPKSVAKPEYPYNHTINFPGGLAIEFDCTKDKKRLGLMHSHNSYLEFQENKDGDGDNHTNLVIRTNGHRYDITKGTHYVYGTEHLAIGSHSKVMMKTGSEFDAKLDGYGRFRSDRGMTLDVQRGMTFAANQQIGMDCMGFRRKNIGKENSSTIGLLQQRFLGIQTRTGMSMTIEICGGIKKLISAGINFVTSAKTIVSGG